MLRPMTNEGQWIRAEREARGWSRDTLAHRSGVSARLIARYEKGDTEPGSVNMGKIAGAFEIELPWEIITRVYAPADSLNPLILA